MHENARTGCVFFPLMNDIFPAWASTFTPACDAGQAETITVSRREMVQACHV